jgi:hypothetical protein
MIACMLPMVLVAAWLGSASSGVYGHYAQTLGSAALHDQRLATVIMWLGGVPAFAVPAFRLAWNPRRRVEAVGSQHAPA